MSGRAPMSVLVTGANRGIGRLAARELLRRGHRVVITARRAQDGEEVRDELADSVPGARVEWRQLDLASFASVRALAEELGRAGRPLDVVVHNAGTLVPPEHRRLTSDGVEETLQVHAVGPYLLSRLLLPVLARPSRLVFITSSLHGPGSRGVSVRFRFEDPFLDLGYHPERAYKNAKLAQLWLMQEWERRYGRQGVHADAVCPGFVPVTASANAQGGTRLLLRWVLPGMPFATTPRVAAAIEADWAERDPAAPGGEYFDGSKVTAPSADAQDPDKAAAFWSLLERWAPT